MWNHEKKKKYPQRITKIKSSINKCKWERIGFPSENNDSKKIKKNNVAIALHVLCAKKNKE